MVLPSRGSSSGGQREYSERGQMNPIGLTLVFGFVLIGSILVVGLGVTQLDGSQSELDAERAEKSLSQLNSRAAIVAFEGGDTQQITLPSTRGSEYELDEDAGWMHVTVTNTSSGNVTTVVNKTLGEIRYEGDGTTVAYQGGGVWRKWGQGNSDMVSAPEFKYRDATLTLPLITISGEASLNGELTLESGNTTKHYPQTDTAGLRNPLEDGRATVRVHSEYYRGWGSFFEQRTQGTVDYDDENNTVKLTLTVPADGNTIRGAMVSGGTGTSIDLKSGAEIDSYDSSVGDYATTGGGNDGDIYAAGEVNMKKDATINGNLIVQDTLIMKKGTEVTGDVENDTTIDFTDSPSSHIGGQIKPGADVPELEAVDGRIDSKRSALSSDSDNDNEDHSSNITALENRGTCDPCNLTSGQYYLEDIDLEDSGQLYLKPDGGTIEIMVDGQVITNNDADIEVIGNGRVEVYVDRYVELKANTEITNDGDDAPQFWLYMNHDEDVDFKKNSVFTGVVYGPGVGGEASGGVEISTKATNQIYGALIGDVDEVKAGNYIHYDTALSNSMSSDDDASYPALTFLHITTNEIKVTSE